MRRVLGTYFKNVLKHLPLEMVSRAIKKPVTEIISFFYGNCLFNYPTLVSMIKLTNNTEEDLQEFLKSHSYFEFEYWSYLYPKSRGLDCLRFIISDYLKIKNISYSKISKAMGTSQPYISNILLGKREISYRKLCDFAAALETTPEQLLEDLRLDTPIQEVNKSQFLNDFKIKREQKGLSQSDVAHYTGIALNSYARFENGDKTISYKSIMKITKILEMDYETTIKKALEFHLINNPISEPELYFSVSPKGYRRKIYEGSVSNTLNYVSKYEYIQHNNNKIRSSSFLLITYLCLFYNKNMSIHKDDELLYALEHIKDENISRGFLDAEYRQFSTKELFNTYKVNKGYSLRDIEFFTNYSAPHICNAFNTGISSPNFLFKICQCLDAPLSVFLEDSILNKTQNNYEEEIIELSEVYKYVSNYVLLNFYHEKVNLLNFVTICNTIMSDDTALDKLNIIKNLK